MCMEKKTSFFSVHPYISDPIGLYVDTNSSTLCRAGS